MEEKNQKMRIIQETVPGKQITLAHLIANPDQIIYKKLGLNPHVDYQKSSIGIITMTPSETAIIAGDLAVKTANIDLGFVDRFSGTLIITGKISEVESAMRAITNYARNALGFTICDVTRT
ncbi:BMC domain-containing protein [Proteiniclasticum sp. C24MP]|uniref:BMC domain-containing protein n=1 Tax=Proteiniclasticum sp. C24MP TaxID=3374101 RepID=UPI003754593A